MTVPQVRIQIVKHQQRLKMDDEKSNSFILDTSIIAPLAIAAGVVFVIVVFLYCCRNFVYNKRYLGNRGRSERVGSGRYPSPTQHSGGRRIVIQPRGRGRVSENLAAFQHHFMPWSTHRYYQRNGSEQQIPPTSTHNRANYNSTQVRRVNGCAWEVQLLRFPPSP